MGSTQSSSIQSSSIQESYGIPQSAKEMAQQLATGGDWVRGHYIHRPEAGCPFTQALLQDSYRLLDELGCCYQRYSYLPFQETRLNNNLIEYHLYRCHGDKVTSRFGWHQDDGGAIEGKVYTILYYLRKDEGIEGGDLLYSTSPNDPCSLIAKVTGKEPTFERVVVDTGKVVVMRGDIWHCPEDMSGNGERHLLVVQVLRYN